MGGPDLASARPGPSAMMLGRFAVAGAQSAAAIHLRNFQVTYGPNFTPPSLALFDDVTCVFGWVKTLRSLGGERTTWRGG